MDFAGRTHVCFYSPHNPIFKGYIKMTDFSPDQDFPPIVSWHKDAEKKEMTESKSGKPRYILPDGEYHTNFFAWTDFAENVDNNGRPEY